MSYNIRPINFPIYERNLVQGNASDPYGGVPAIELPKGEIGKSIPITDPRYPIPGKIGQPAPHPLPVTPATTPAPAASGLPDISGLLDQSVFGIPVKYLAIGAALYFFVLRKH